MDPTPSAWAAVLAHLPEYLSGLRVTVEVSVIAFVLGLVLGVLGASARRGRLALVRFVAAVYVEAFRNTPLLLQVFVAYFGLPAVGLPLTNFQAGILALALNAGAYLTEAIRGGIEAVPQGQYDATHVLGLGRTDTFLHIVLPQAIRNVFPPIVNQFIQVVLGSSLLSAIALRELTGASQTVNSITLRTMQAFAVALVLYLIVSNVISALAGIVARFAFRPPLETSTRGGGRNPLRRILSGAVVGRPDIASAEGGVSQ